MQDILFQRFFCNGVVFMDSRYGSYFVPRTEYGKGHGLAFQIRVLHLRLVPTSFSQPPIQLHSDLLTLLSRDYQMPCHNMSG